jgi:hypothetical protein
LTPAKVIFIDGGEFFTDYAAKKLAACLRRLQKAATGECFNCGRQPLFGEATVVVLGADRLTSVEIFANTSDGKRAAFYTWDGEIDNQQAPTDPEQLIALQGKLIAGHNK